MGFLGATLKDAISNVLAFVLVIAGAANAYLQSVSGEIDYFQLVIAVIAAVVAYLTGKSSDAKSKVG